MTAEEKVFEALRLINERTKVTAKTEHCFIVESGLDGDLNRDLPSIFKKLEVETGTIKLVDIPHFTVGDGSDINNDEYFSSYEIEVLDTFHDYYEAELEKRNAKAEVSIGKLTNANFYKVYDTMTDIEDELNMTASNVVTIDAAHTNEWIWKAVNNTSLSEAEITKIRQKSIELLKELGAIKKVVVNNKVAEDPLDGILYDEPSSFTITLDRQKFASELKGTRDYLKNLREIDKIFAEVHNEKPDNAYKPVEDVEQPLYSVTFNDDGIFVNGLYLTKPQFGSINYDFFEKLHKEPNVRHDTKKLLETLNHDTKKTVHQILNDLGFKNDYKKLFFPKASNKSIEFRNPITAISLKNSGIEHLRVENGRKAVEKGRNKKK